MANIQKKWYLFDATNKVLGRLATSIVKLLTGKYKPDYMPDRDCGDYVIVINASKVRLTGKKLDQKIHYRHSGYPGGDKYTPYRKLMEKHPEAAIYLAVKGMLPKNKLRAKYLKKLKIYPMETHPHEAQRPQIVQF